MITEPMLAGKVLNMDVNTVSYPCMGSVKLDGVRALVVDGKLVSRNFKPIPNRWCQRMFANLPQGTDGELIYGDPTHPDAYRNTISSVMTEDGEPTQVCYHIFDNFKFPGGFAVRFSNLQNYSGQNVFVVPHSVIRSAAELDAVEKIALEAGYEGIMVRSLDGPYKAGRSTTREGYLLKLKRFEDAEAVVLDTFEFEQNTNTATTNATGHTERSSHKSGMRAAGVLGGLEVRGINGPYEGVEFRIGSGFSGAAAEGGQRWRLWQVRSTLVGKIVKYKYFPTGSKDKPRFPIFLGWRDPIDL